MKYRLLLLSLLLALLFQQLCHAQNKPEQDSSKQMTDESAIMAIPASEIARSSNDATLKLNDIRQLLKPDPAVIQIDSLLSEFIKEVSINKRELEQRNLERTPLRKLRELQDEWFEHKHRLDQWQEILQFSQFS